MLHLKTAPVRGAWKKSPGECPGLSSSARISRWSVLHHAPLDHLIADSVSEADDDIDEAMAVPPRPDDGQRHAPGSNPHDADVEQQRQASAEIDGADDGEEGEPGDGEGGHDRPFLFCGRSP